MQGFRHCTCLVNKVGTASYRGSLARASLQRLIASVRPKTDTLKFVTEKNQEDTNNFLCAMRLPLPTYRIVTLWVSQVVILSGLGATASVQSVKSFRGSQLPKGTTSVSKFLCTHREREREGVRHQLITRVFTLRPVIGVHPQDMAVSERR